MVRRRLPAGSRPSPCWLPADSPLRLKTWWLSADSLLRLADGWHATGNLPALCWLPAQVGFLLNPHPGRRLAGSPLALPVRWYVTGGLLAPPGSACPLLARRQAGRSLVRRWPPVVSLLSPHRLPTLGSSTLGHFRHLAGYLLAPCWLPAQVDSQQALSSLHADILPAQAGGPLTRHLQPCSPLAAQSG